MRDRFYHRTYTQHASDQTLAQKFARLIVHKLGLCDVVAEVQAGSAAFGQVTIKASQYGASALFTLKPVTGPSEQKFQLVSISESKAYDPPARIVMPEEVESASGFIITRLDAMNAFRNRPYHAPRPR